MLEEVSDMAFFEPDACSERSAREGEVRVWSDVTEAELCERFQRLWVPKPYGV